MDRLKLATEQFSERLKEAAREVGLENPPTDVQRALGGRYDTVHRWFEGKSTPSYGNAIRLADYFQEEGISPLWLLMDQGPMLQVDATAPATLEALRKLDDAFRELRELGKGGEAGDRQGGSG